METPTRWVHYLPWAEFSYNSSYHSAIGTSPLQIVYGRLPPSISPYTENTTPIEAVDELLTHRDSILRQLREHLHRTRQHMKIQADKKRRDVHFAVGDQVLVKLQPYRQRSVRQQTYSKLRRRFYGPFEVLEKLGPVAYKLLLPDQSRIHPVFHVSLLKPYRQNASFHTTPLPSVAWHNHPLTKPVAILRTRSVRRGVQESLELLVQWNHLPLEDASWISYSEFQQAFPDSDLAGKISLSTGEGIDTTPHQTQHLIPEQEGKLVASGGRENTDKEVASGVLNEAGGQPRQSGRVRKTPHWHQEYAMGQSD